MDKKSALIGGVMGGILIYMVPGMFLTLTPVIDLLIKGVAIVVMAGGIIYFVAGDVLLKKGTSDKYNKQLQQKIKAGEITPEQAFEEQKKEYARNIELARLEVELEKEKFRLEKEKAEIKKVNQPVQTSGEKETTGKMPDVLSNIGGLFGTGNKEQPKQEEKKMPDVLNNISEVTAIPVKKKDNSEELRKLF